ncbi:MAG TPA: hypothetical protein VIV58_10965 [Kofleriaceae bacterium]
MKRAAITLALCMAAPAAAQDPPGYKLDVPEHLDVDTGGGTLPLAITVERGQTISKDGGLTLDIAPDAGISVRRRRLARTDAVDPDEDSPRFAIPLRTDTAGDFRLKLHLRFWLCGTKVCKPVDARRTVTVSVHQRQ